MRCAAVMYLLPREQYLVLRLQSVLPPELLAQRAELRANDFFELRQQVFVGAIMVNSYVVRPATKR